ncbi:hypothetical protein [Polaribacter sp. Asnod1-A03]|uniref:hypothetical protein n=1 Tax=Polaribacter sp. Asnod1-A03 TaxID=3160581 RepID=UPI003864A2AC
MKEKRKKGILIYFGLVMLYFLGCFAFSDYYKGVDEDITLTVLAVSVPIILSLFWTYILEAIKKKL